MTVSRSSLNSPFFVITEPAATHAVNHMAATHTDRLHPPVEATLKQLPGRLPGSGVVFRDEATSFEFGESRPSRTMSCLGNSVSSVNMGAQSHRWEEQNSRKWGVQVKT